MTVRDQPETRPDASAADPDRLVVVFHDPAARRARRTWRLGLAVLAFLVSLGAWSWWLAGGEDKVEARPTTVAPAPAPVDVPAGLRVSVRAPATVVAGRPARFVVSYSDGAGIFSGATEDWGDTGVGSVSLAACTASAPAAVALQASYVAAHTWAKADSYPVSFTVTTYTCHDGRAKEETRTARVTVVVAAR